MEVTFSGHRVVIPGDFIDLHAWFGKNRDNAMIALCMAIRTTAPEEGPALTSLSAFPYLPAHYSVENRLILVKQVISKMLITFERNEIEGWALCRSTQKCLRYRLTKLELIVALETFSENCWSISIGQAD